MVIDDVSQGRRLQHVGLGLTEDEARELRDTLTILLDDQSVRHEHVASVDYQTEITVWIERVSEI